MGSGWLAVGEAAACVGGREGGTEMRWEGEMRRRIFVCGEWREAGQACGVDEVAAFEPMTVKIVLDLFWSISFV